MGTTGGIWSNILASKKLLAWWNHEKFSAEFMLSFLEQRSHMALTKVRTPQTCFPSGIYISQAMYVWHNTFLRDLQISWKLSMQPLYWAVLTNSPCTFISFNALYSTHTASPKKTNLYKLCWVFFSWLLWQISPKTGTELFLKRIN